MNLENSIALVTGANRGLGKAYSDTLLAAGAAKVYAGARDPSFVAITDPRVVPVKLDVTQDEDVRAAAAACADVNLLINNAGIMLASPMLADGSESASPRRNGSERLRNAPHGSRLCARAGQKRRRRNREYCCRS